MALTPEFVSDSYLHNGICYTVERNSKGETKAFCQLALPNGKPDPKAEKREITRRDQLPCIELQEKFDTLQLGLTPSRRFKDKKLIKPEDVDRPRAQVS